MKKEKIEILYEDKYIRVVNKKTGLLTISTNKEVEKTLYHQVREYIKGKNKNNKVFIVHRLDKDTSGIVLFAKNEEIKNYLQNNWNNVKREYLAVVNGNIKKERGTIRSYLKETKTFLVYSTNDKNGKLAITNYEKIKSNQDYSLLKIIIETGRKNQIRVHLSDLGYPIVGDKKYSNIKDNVHRLYLHANVLEFYHPILKKAIRIESNMPKEFKTLI